MFLRLELFDAASLEHLVEQATGVLRVLFSVQPPDAVESGGGEYSVAAVSSRADPCILVSFFQSFMLSTKPNVSDPTIETGCCSSAAKSQMKKKAQESEQTWVMTIPQLAIRFFL